MIRTTPALESYTRFSCPNPHCARFNRPGEGNITHRSWTGIHKHIERLRCTACDREFSEREGTLMARSKLSEGTVERLLKCQRWGVCDEGIADICAVDLKTVYRFQRVATQRAQTHHQQVVRDVDVPACSWMKPMRNCVLNRWNGCIRRWQWGAGFSCGSTLAHAHRRWRPP